MPVGETYVGWACLESDNSMLEIVRRVVLPKKAWKPMGRGHWQCEAHIELEPEMVLSCEYDSIQVIEAQAEVVPCLTTGEVIPDFVDSLWLHAFAVVPRHSRKPPAMLLRVRGVRRGCDAQWPRYSEGEAARNELFYGTATLLSPAGGSYGLPPLIAGDLLSPTETPPTIHEAH